MSAREANDGIEAKLCPGKRHRAASLRLARGLLIDYGGMAGYGRRVAVPCFFADGDFPLLVASACIETKRG